MINATYKNANRSIDVPTSYPNTTRVQRLREAAASRSHLVTPVLRDLSYEPYTFVASAPKTKTGTGAAGNALVGRGGERGGGGAGGEEEGWDDWGDDDNEMGVR